jgi:hypothetical protein
MCEPSALQSNFQPFIKKPTLKQQMLYAADAEATSSTCNYGTAMKCANIVNQRHCPLGLCHGNQPENTMFLCLAHMYMLGSKATVCSHVMNLS